MSLEEDASSETQTCQELTDIPSGDKFLSTGPVNHRHNTFTDYPGRS